MIQCMTLEQFQYWIELMSDIATQISPVLWKIEAETQTVLWELTGADRWCIRRE